MNVKLLQGIIRSHHSHAGKLRKAGSIGFLAGLLLNAGIANAQCPSATVGSSATICASTSSVVLPVNGLSGGIVHTVTATYNYTGDVQTYTVPAGATSVNVDMSGAQGQETFGGNGGRVQGTLSVTAGEVLNVYVGGNNGYNGGGASIYSRAGGGASDIRVGGTALGNRVMVAGGGGGGGRITLTIGGLGGGTTGGTATHYYDSPNATGGSQSAGGAIGVNGSVASGVAGSLGQGGASGNNPGSNDYAGGGGGGYYGGGGGGNDGGGGGSSYTDPVTVSAVTHTQGYKTGNGIVTVQGVTSPYTYNVAWSSAATSAGFASASGVLFDTSTMISISAPTSAPAATYTGTLTLSNGSCNVNYPVSINVVPPVTLGSNPSICAGATSASIPFSYVGCTILDPISATFNYTGGVQTYTVPAGATSVNVDMSGAQGQETFGGNGGRVQGTLSVTAGEVLNVYVGGNNGYNGGGASIYSRAGGGASDIRVGGTALGNRVMVAGGGGGGGRITLAIGGLGGGTTGGTATHYYDSPNATGGSQSAGGAIGVNGSVASGVAGSLGQGGASGNNPGSNDYAGGGGGGYYGGGGGGNDGGGGGSSYTDPVTVSAVTHTQGYKTGNGAVTISGAATAVYKYNIAWSSAAITAGFSNVTNASLTGSSINFSTPAGATAAVYTGTVTITHSTFSSTYPVNVTVNPVPASILGTATVCQLSTTSLSDGVTGGIWTSSGTGVATVDPSTGLVSGVSAGTSTISYSTGCGTAATAVVTVNGAPSAGTISGPSTVAITSSITLTDAVTGGVWSASNSNATVTGGLVTGMALGSVTISYAVTGTCGTAYSMKNITVNSSSLPDISGTPAMCVGTTTSLSDAATGGTWSSNNIIVATVGATTGIVTGASAGTANITYTLGGIYTTLAVTVNANPLPIHGAISECQGLSILLSDATTGGVWSSSNGNVTVDGSGNVMGSIAGTSTITYSDGVCYTTYSNTVFANPTAILGASTVCMGSTLMLSDATAGATSWTSNNTSVATVINSGLVTPVSSGTTVITYKISSGCITTTVISVNPLPGAVTGSIPVCVGTSVTLSDPAGTGTWASSTATVATVGSSSGVVTGVAAGTSRITYTADVTGCTAIAIATVNAIHPITGSTYLVAGSTAILTDATAGGTWTSGNTGVVTVGSTGRLTGVSVGTGAITYALATGCSATTTVSVNAASPITGVTGSVCQRVNIPLSNSTPGGVWSSSNAGIASVNGLGVVTMSSVNTGTATISYTVGGWSATVVVTVNLLPHPIQGVTSLCYGTTISLSDATAGGTWSSSTSNTSIAGAGSTISVTGTTPGNSAITYQLSNGCSITYLMTVNPNPTAILGNFNACMGSATTLSDATSGSLSWTTSTPGVATIVNSGVLTPVAVGTTTITYKIVTGNCFTTQVITVNAVPVVTAIQGAASISHNTPTTLSDATASGVWSSSNSAVIALGGSTGSPITATAIASSGSAVISYAVTNATGCKTTVTKTITATPAPPHHGGSTGVNPGPIAESEVQLYPNPTSGAINIKADVTGVFYLYSLDGKSLGEYKIAVGITSIALPGELANGIYMGRYVDDNKHIALFKIVKE